jgi:hypothetical protein
MEMHHLHRHNQESGFKRYFNEFFILFFAITASFFVENYRERYIEHHREKQFIISLVKDIQIDTSEMGNIRNSIDIQISGIDSLIKVLEKPETDSTIGQIYYYSLKYLASAGLFEATDRTISQLKNAGGLRLIQKEGASDSIMAYYNLIDNIKYNTEFNLRQFERILCLMKEMFDFKILKKYDFYSIKKSTDLKIYLANPSQLNTYYNEALLFESSLYEYNKLLISQTKNAVVLLDFLKTSYKIK